jgi:hypothetical protein
MTMMCLTILTPSFHVDAEDAEEVFDDRPAILKGYDVQGTTGQSSHLDYLKGYTQGERPKTGTERPKTGERPKTAETPGGGKKSNGPPPTEKQVDEVRKKFNKFDKDGSGEIDSRELLKLIRSVTGQDFDGEELEEAMMQMDPDKSGSVSWAEFKAWFFD